METKCASFPPSKNDLRNHFGYLSFNCTLINVDIVGVKLLNSSEIVVITYRGNRKTGFIYEGEKLTSNQVFAVFNDVPYEWNDLEKYEAAYPGRIEILAPAKDNYVFINDIEIIKK